MKKLLINKLLDVQFLPKVETVNLLLAIEETSIPKVATKARVSKAAAYADIHGVKPCPRFRKQIEQVLGCVPWAA